MIKWGIIGLGNMANSFAEAAKGIEDVNINGIASLSKNKLKNFGIKFNISEEKHFNNYDDLISNDSVDAIYISTLNNTHSEIINKCIKSKKNILCEKPVVTNKRELDDLIKNLKMYDKVFLEGIAFRSHPITESILKILNEKKLGKVKSIEANFGFNTKKINPNSRLFNKNFGGGAILDLGCYPLSIINLIKNFYNKENVITFKSIDGTMCDTGVDSFGLAELAIGDDIKCKISVGIQKVLDNKVLINTENGQIKINEPWLPQKKSLIEVQQGSNYFKHFVECENTIYANQIVFFNDLLNKNKKNQFPYLTNEDTFEIAKLSIEWREKLYKKKIN